MARDKFADRRAAARRESADSVEEALRRLGADILAEPVPERLRRVLRQSVGSDQEPPTSDAPPDDVPDDPPERG